MHGYHGWTRSGWLAGALAAGFLAVPLARAGNNGFWTTYNSEVEQGEMELMLMNDITAPSRYRRAEGMGDYFSHMVELEYGLTKQLATELMIEWFEDIDRGERRFTGFRWENRYRLFGQSVLLNPMIYAEYEDLDPRTRYKMEVSGWVRPPYKDAGEEPDRERILETRVILSDDLGPLNVAFNWINETDITTGYTAFGYAAGVMWMSHQHEEEPAVSAGGAVRPREYSCPMHADVRQGEPGTCPRCGMPLRAADDDDEAEGVGVGLEAYGALGDTKAFALDLPRQEHYLGPILMIHLTRRWMVHAQLAIGLSYASDDLVRVNLGYEL